MIKFNHQNALLVMTHIKLGDFLVMTPHLRQLEKNYPNIIIAVPDFLFPLFHEQKIFGYAIRNSEVDAHLGRYNKRSVLNLSFPLIPNLQTGPDHFTLRKECFVKPRHVFQSYAEALKDYFPNLPDDTKQEPYLDFDIDQDVCKKWSVQPFGYFTIHSGSDFAPKNWAPKNYEELAVQLLDRYPNIKCVSLVGPSDQPLFQDRLQPKNFISVNDDLRKISHLLMGSLFHVDNDSGIHHLAGVANVPSITVFGATGPGSWASLTERNFIHWGAPNCPNPCDGVRIADCSDRVCISSVKVDHLVQSAHTILSAYQF